MDAKQHQEGMMINIVCQNFVFAKNPTKHLKNTPAKQDTPTKQKLVLFIILWP